MAAKGHKVETLGVEMIRWQSRAEKGTQDLARAAEENEKMAQELKELKDQAKYVAKEVSKAKTEREKVYALQKLRTNAINNKKDVY